MNNVNYLEVMAGGHCFKCHRDYEDPQHPLTCTERVAQNKDGGAMSCGKLHGKECEFTPPQKEDCNHKGFEVYNEETLKFYCKKCGKIEGESVKEDWEVVFDKGNNTDNISDPSSDTKWVKEFIREIIHKDRERVKEIIKEEISILNDTSKKIYDKNLFEDNQLSNDHAMAIAVRNEVLSALLNKLDK